MSASSSSVADELERLAALQRSGVLTEDEFKAQKARLLNPASTTDTRGKKPRSVFKRIVLWTAVILIGFVIFVFVNDEYPETFMSGLPKCDSREARKMVERTVEENSVGLAAGRKIIQWVGDDPQGPPTANSVRCHARVTMNAGGEVGMTYVFEKNDDGTLINIEFD